LAQFGKVGPNEVVGRSASEMRPGCACSADSWKIRKLEAFHHELKSSADGKICIYKKKLNSTSRAENSRGEFIVTISAKKIIIILKYSSPHNRRRNDNEIILANTCSCTRPEACTPRTGLTLATCMNVTDVQRWRKQTKQL
jgi:hypothetical protein